MGDSDDEKAEQQLHAELHESIQRAHRLRRPILTHLNADTTWVLSIPYPARTAAPCGRSRYNILIDPWFQGPQEDVAGWFSRQWHMAKSSVESQDELDSLLQDAEALDYEGGHIPEDATGSSYVDAVAISHEFTDHCHRSTLLALDPDIPVFATRKAAQLIRLWKHFRTVIDIGPFVRGQDWRKTSISPLPGWIGISRITTTFDALHFHSAVVICIQQPGSVVESAETVMYTPHGVEASTLSTLATADPALSTLALLHGLHDVSIAWSKQLNLGAVNALKAQKMLKAKYWIGTHDEDKGKSGIIAHLLCRKPLTVAEALATIRATVNDDRQGTIVSGDEPTCVELRNGESLLLE